MIRGMQVGSFQNSFVSTVILAGAGIGARWGSTMRSFALMAACSMLVGGGVGQLSCGP